MTVEPLRTLIADDEPVARRRLAVLCADISQVRIVGEAVDGADTIDKIGSLSPDLVLLDISMPELDGLTVAVRAASLGSNPLIVFCTASEKEALRAFELSAVDYLLKPVGRDRLQHAVDRATGLRLGRRRSAPPDWIDHLWVPQRGVMRRIDVADMIRIDAEGDFVRIWCRGGSVLLNQTLTSLSGQLDPTIFLRLRRSVVIRATEVRGLRHVGLGAWEAQLADGHTIRIGPTYWKAIKQRLREMLPGQA